MKDYGSNRPRSGGERDVGGGPVGRDLYVLFKVNMEKHNLESEEDKKLVEVLFN